ncbi:MAG TPA: trypsin-like peptidase domain-containing protein [Thermoanaerobaculia bacterium]
MSQDRIRDGARRIVLRIVSGARGNQVEEVPIHGAGELVFGRDPDVAVKLDSELDNLVSRRHARISWPSADTVEFTLTDLGSSNGTLHNGTRISGAERLRPGDTLQLGVGGPKIVFDLDPRPELPPATRLASAAPTRYPPAVTGAADSVAVVASVPIGRATVERMVAGSQRHSRRWLQLLGLAVAVLAVAGAAVFYTSRREIAATSAGGPVSPAEIADRYTFSTVYIEAAWTLVHTYTGEEVYHRRMREPDGSGERLPAYVLLPDGSIEPWLWPGSEGGTNLKILANVAGSGFIVKEDGFILTNRHVAAGWRSAYDLPLPGRLFRYDPDREPVQLPLLKQKDRGRLPRYWVPTQALFLGKKQITGKLVDGRHIYLDATFPKNTLRIPARLVRISDEHDVALIKIDLPNQEVTPVELDDNYDQIRVGQQVSVLGYPAISPAVEVMVESQDALNRASQWRQMPEPSLNVGVVGRVIRKRVTAAGEPFSYWSDVGDAYQLTVDTAGPGNSGGPVFDDRGRVIGIFTYRASRDDVTVTFAVPIRYGDALMKITQVVD